jgi:hypothetical protein
LQAIGILENVRKPTFGWSSNHVSTPKIKPLGIKSHEIQVVQIIPQFKNQKCNTWIKKMETIKSFGIKMALWLAPLPSPKEMKVQSA